ncbi:MAG: YdcF family protein [Oscillospiraceae bacterium]
MRISQISEDNITDEIVDRVLFEGIRDNGENADCIIVLGSSKAVQYRVPAAVNAYENSRSLKLLMCGGPRQLSNGENVIEAENMCNRALELGVPADAIICEKNSKNTIENFLFAMVELQRAFWLNRIHSVLLVTTTYHMRRSLALARYLFPAHIEVYPCPVDDTNTKRSNWMNSEEGRKRAIAETANIIRCVKNGVFPDFEI